jgi:hypothetical protein
MTRRRHAAAPRGGAPGTLRGGAPVAAAAAAPPLGARDAETARVATALIAARDIAALRKLAAVRGLATHAVRRRAWPLLLGLGAGDAPPPAAAAAAAVPPADARVVEVDVARSLWALTEGWGAAARDAKRAELRRVIEAALAPAEGDEDERSGVNYTDGPSSSAALSSCSSAALSSSRVYYYQGMHDVAAVLLFVAGEASAARLLRALARRHLRDATRATLAPAAEALALLYPLIGAADPELARYIAGEGGPALESPLFALSWTLTWFAHDVPALPQAARLFDLFLAGHPLMPLYVAAAAARRGRAAVLACGAGGGDEAYAALRRLRVLPAGAAEGGAGADALAREALELYRALPPAALAARAQLRACVAADAFLAGGRWHVPAAPLARELRPALLPPARKAAGGGSARRRRPALAAAALAALAAGALGAAGLGLLFLLQLDALALGNAEYS